MLPNSTPITVMMGMRIVFRTWTQTMRRSVRPLARANLTKSSGIVSRTPVRVRRRTSETLNSDRLSAGRMRWARPEAVSKLWGCRISHGVAAPGRRQPAEPDREDHHQHHALPEIRQAEAEDRTGHRRLVEETVRPEPGPQTERDANDERDETAPRSANLQRRRQALEDQLDRRLVEYEGPAEVAMHAFDRKRQILLGQRAVEAEIVDRMVNIGLGGIRRDQNVDRIADGIDADEHEQRCERRARARSGRGGG